MATKSWRIPLALALISWGAVLAPAYLVSALPRDPLPVADPAELAALAQAACTCAGTARGHASVRRCWALHDEASGGATRPSCRSTATVMQCSEPDGRCVRIDVPTARP